MIIPYVYDAGALISLDLGDRQGLLRHQSAVEIARPVLVPAVVLTQVWRDHRKQHHLARFLRSCEVVPVGDRMGRVAGELCAASGTSDAVDALVVTVAAAIGPAVIWTSDPGDIERLRSCLPAPAAVLVEQV